MPQPPPVPAALSHRCSGCGRCVSACPDRLISLELLGRRKQAELFAPEACTHCGKCAAACPLSPPRPSDE